MSLSARTPCILGLFTILCLLVGSLFWCATTPLANTVVFSGQIDVQRSRQVVQHDEGGVVVEIRVQNGSLVKVGDILFRLDGSALKSELAVVESRLTERLMLRARLKAEIDAVPFQFSLGDPQAIRGLTQDSAALFESQSEAFEAFQINAASQAKILQERIQGAEREIDGMDVQTVALTTEAGLIEAELRNQQLLMKNGLSPASRVVALQRDLARLSGAQGELMVSRARAEGRIVEAKNEYSETIARRREDAIKELGVVTQDILEVTERRDALARRVNSLEIRSPVDGVVADLRVTSTDSVIGRAEPLLSIVPQDRPLVAVARIPLELVNKVRPGQVVWLHLAGQERYDTPELQGAVSTVSAVAFLDETDGRAYFRMEVALSAATSESLRSLRALPGVQLDLTIRTEAISPWTGAVQGLGSFIQKAIQTR
jgi:HlyD family secretion protein